MPTATLSNYLWLPKGAVSGTPPEFAPEWEYEIPLLKTPEGRMMQQQIAALIEELGDDSGLKELTDEDMLTIRNWTEVGDKWWALSCGDTKKSLDLAKRLGLKVKDRRVEAPWPEEVASRLKLLMKPRDYQIEPFQKWMKAGHGIFHAAPAFGKTFMMVSQVMARKEYVLVLTHTDYLAEQFLTRFTKGSPVSDDEDETEFIPVTNCLEVEEELGIQIAGRYRKPDEIWPVTVATYQSFISKGGRKALKQLSKSFGMVLCDECHVFAAPAPASVVNGFHAKRRYGVTATPSRKDKLDVVLYDILGPITAKGVAKQLQVTATMIATGATYKGARVPRRGEWAWMLNSLSKNEARNDLIMRWVHHDVEQGRNLLLLSDRRQWCLDIVERLNKEGIPARAVLGGMTSKKGIEKRNEIIDEMMNGDIKVICATQVFKLGVDIPCLDTLYATCPMSNEPLLEQMLGRIRRFYEGKKEPVFRYFADGGHGQLYGCTKGTHSHLIKQGVDIILVPEGKKPEQVTFGDGYGSAAAEGSASRRKKRGIRRAASKSPSQVAKLFDDLREEARLHNRYKERMGGQAS